MEIGIAAITLPAAYRQDEIDAGLIGHAGKVQTIQPTCRPALRHLGGRAAGGTIGSEHPDLEGVRVVHAEAVTHRSITNCHLIGSGISGNGNQGSTIYNTRGRKCGGSEVRTHSCRESEMRTSEPKPH